MDLRAGMIMQRELADVPGLSEEEAARLLRADGPNELPAAKPRRFLAIAWSVVREPMVLLLVSAGAVYFVLGELRDALVLVVSVVVVVGISLYQERKTERALGALRDLSSPRALVIRDGRERRIAGREVVRGDIVVLSEGDRVPADGLVLAAGNLSVDESLLTGESAAVRKAPGDPRGAMGRPGGDDLPCVFSGTLVVAGQGTAAVRATGAHTELGKIGRALEGFTPERTRLQREVNRLTIIMAVAGLSICVLVAILYGLTRGDWKQGLLTGITSAMSLLPEEFPVVLTLFLAFGAWRISRHRVLARNSEAIETLGSATVLCTDKTGTITQNRMAVEEISAGEDHLGSAAEPREVPGACRELIGYAALASRPEPFDPMEIAIHRFARDHPGGPGAPASGWELEREYPLSGSLPAISQVWLPAAGEGPRIVAAKGAPESIAELCRLSPERRGELGQRVEEMAGRGLRVLGVARGELGRRDPLPAGQTGLNLEFLGLLGLADPIRDEVPAFVQECYGAGIRVVMITGDYPVTAQSIASRIGMRRTGGVVTGRELDRIDDAELTARVRETDIFARVQPEQKLRLVEAFRACGEVVAMTGDGVNDAPALRTAQIGIAMGGRGTDVAREAADLVLTDDSFPSIVLAIRMGRQIFDNIRKAMSFVLAVHVPLAGLVLVPVLARWPLVILPIHVVFLELIVDPACTIAFEAEPAEKGLMRRPPRNPRDPLFSRSMVLVSVLEGASVLAAVLLVLFYELHRGASAEHARAVTFSTLVVGNLMLILVNRSATRPIILTLRSPNAALWWVVGGAFATLALVLYVPFLRELFRFARLEWREVGLCLLAGGLSLAWFEGWKMIRLWRGSRRARL